MKRNIICIDENKCNGCGKCVIDCHECAIEIINGKAKLISDKYCDGLGDCLKGCPLDAIHIVEREAEAYSEVAVKERIDKRKNDNCRCIGSMARKINKKVTNTERDKLVNKGAKDTYIINENVSELRQWPIQLKLIDIKSDFLKNADVLIAGDCTAYAYGNFHRDFIKDKVVIIGCPKLDDNEYYRRKIGEILMRGNIRSIKVVRMSVPCCYGIVRAVKGAMFDVNINVPYDEIIIDFNGNIL